MNLPGAVCGMTVDPDRAAVLRYKGQTYTFAASLPAPFSREPESFLKKPLSTNRDPDSQVGGQPEITPAEHPEILRDAPRGHLRHGVDHSRFARDEKKPVPPVHGRAGFGLRSSSRSRVRSRMIDLIPAALRA